MLIRIEDLARQQKLPDVEWLHDHPQIEKALLRIASEFPEFKALSETIATYEAQNDDESRFVKALDKIEPVIANYLQDGRTWKEMQVSFVDFAQNKLERTAHVQEISMLLEDIITEIEQRKSHYFDA